MLCFHFVSDHSQALREKTTGGRVMWRAGSLHTSMKCIAIFSELTCTVIQPDFVYK